MIKKLLSKLKKLSLTTISMMIVLITVTYQSVDVHAAGMRLVSILKLSISKDGLHTYVDHLFYLFKNHRVLSSC